MLSKDWIYEHIFNIPEADQKIERGKIIEDLKDMFRHTSIQDEGNDPAKQAEPTDVEESLANMKNELRATSSKDKGGRPKESGTYKKDKSPYGRDPLGDKERKSALSGRFSESQIKTIINGISAKKKVINEDSSMLDESNIIDDTKN